MNLEAFYKHSLESNEHYEMHIILDFFNKRIKVEEYTGNVNDMVQRIHELARENNFSKALVKSKKEDWQRFLHQGFMLEGIYEHFFNGNDAYGMVQYFDNERKKSVHWIDEDQILQQVLQLPLQASPALISDEYVLQKANEDDAAALAKLYGAIFPVYPTPLNKEDYILDLMNKDSIFYVVKHQDKVVSAASAHINRTYHSAEISDCATDPEYQKKGLMKALIIALEKELFLDQHYCVYSHARAISFGMNAAFYQLQYKYHGRFTNNCYIVHDLEDMNLWMKDLSKEK